VAHHSSVKEPTGSTEILAALIGAVQAVGFPAAVVVLLLVQFEPRLDNLSVEMQRVESSLSLLSTACIARSTRPPDQ
jgi:hypothetical protein